MFTSEELSVIKDALNIADDHYKKLMDLIDQASKELDADSVSHITGLISMADSLKLYIDKTSLENKVFATYNRFKETPNGPLQALLPMFDWLNFERPDGL